MADSGRSAVATPLRIAAAALALAVPALLASVAATSCSAAEVTLSSLSERTHIHGLAVDRTDPARLLIATHHGLFRAAEDGTTQLLSEVQDFMGFNPHPTDAGTLYASGHPATGGNLGFISSTDQGQTWRQISPGANGPVDFHQIAVSPADPDTIYGAYGPLQVSRDGGKTWSVAGPLPARLIDLAASAESSDTLYAATEPGLFASTDAGKSWTPVLEGAPVTLVEVAADGSILAFVVGRGLLRSPGQPLEFTALGNPVPGGYLLHLAIDPADPDRMFAATGEGKVLTSVDQGRTWAEFGSGR